MTAYVLDASVAAKWVLPGKDEPLAAQAASVLEDFACGRVHFTVPDLFYPEIGNILWKSVRLRRIPASAAYESAAWLQSLRIPASPAAPLLEPALQIAVALNWTVYDSFYLALSHSTGRPLLTADERLVNATGAHFPVRWLGAL